MVNAGPGSYTNLRIGVSTANALAYAWHVELATTNVFAAAQKEMQNEQILWLAPNIHDLVYAGWQEQGKWQLFAGKVSEIPTLISSRVQKHIVNEAWWSDPKTRISQLLQASSPVLSGANGFAQATPWYASAVRIG